MTTSAIAADPCRVNRFEVALNAVPCRFARMTAVLMTAEMTTGTTIAIWGEIIAALDHVHRCTCAVDLMMIADHSIALAHSVKTALAAAACTVDLSTIRAHVIGMTTEAEWTARWTNIEAETARCIRIGDRAAT